MSCRNLEVRKLLCWFRSGRDNWKLDASYAVAGNRSGKILRSKGTLETNIKQRASRIKHLASSLQASRIEQS